MTNITGRDNDGAIDYADGCLGGQGLTTRPATKPAGLRLRAAAHMTATAGASHTLRTALPHSTATRAATAALLAFLHRAAAATSLLHYGFALHPPSTAQHALPSRLGSSPTICYPFAGALRMPTAIWLVATTTTVSGLTQHRQTPGTGCCARRAAQQATRWRAGVLHSATRVTSALRICIPSCGTRT